MKRLLPMIILLIISNLWSPILSVASENSAYFTVAGKTLEVREKPDLSSKVVVVLQYCDKVQFLEDSNIEVKQCSGGSCITGPMFNKNI